MAEQESEQKSAGGAPPSESDAPDGGRDSESQVPQQVPQGGGSEGDAAKAGSAAEPSNRRERRAAAAQRRKHRTQERTAAATVGLATSEIVDDALARGTDKVTKWLKRNFNVFQWILVSGVAVWIGYQIYDYRKGKGEGKASDELMKGVQALNAPVEGEAKAEPEAAVPESAVDDSAPKFKTNEERVKAARESLEQAAKLRPSDGSAIFARLGLASLLVDEGKFDEARKLYEEIKSSKLGQQTSEFQGRSLEGIAISFEAEGNIDAAMKAYRELENTELSGFKEVALLAQARLHFSKGELSQARELMTKLSDLLEKKKASDDKLKGRSYYVEPSVAALKLAVDPESARKPAIDLSALQNGASGGANPVDLEALKKKLEELTQKVGEQPAVGAEGEDDDLAPEPKPEAPVEVAPKPDDAPVAPKAPAPKAPAPAAPKAAQPAAPAAPTPAAPPPVAPVPEPAAPAPAAPVPAAPAPQTP